MPKVAWLYFEFMRYWTKSFASARPNLPDCRHNKSRASFVFQSSALYMSAQYLKSQDQTWLSFFICSKKSLGAHRQFRDQVADFRVFSQQKHEYWFNGQNDEMRRERERETTIRSSIVKMPLLRLCFCSKGNLTIICNDNRGYGLFYATAEPEMRTQMSALPLTAASRRKKFEQFALMMCRIHWKILSSIEL